MSPRPYRLGARSAAVAGTRARVVAAARELLTERGFHLVSVDGIAARADVARATVYHQFRSKLGVLEAVVADFEERAGLAALAAVVETAPPERLVRDVVSGGCAYWATDPELVRRVVAVGSTDPDAAHLLAGHDAGRLRLLTRVVDRLDADGRVRPACPRERALDVLWVVTGFAAYDDLARGRGMTAGAAADVLSGLAEAALRPADAGSP